MPYLISDLKNAIARKLHGTTANKLTDFYGLLYDVAVRCQTDCDFEETRRTVALATPLYGQAAFDYACPADVKGNRIIDLRPQANRQRNNITTQQNSQDFDIGKANVLAGSKIEVRWNGYVKTLRAALPVKANVLINACDSVDGNGTWSVGGGASDIETDNLYFTQGTGSLKYSLNGDSHIINTTMTAVDLTNYEDVGVIFAWAYCQSTLPTSMTLRWGSDATANYWSKAVTTQWDGTAFKEGWNLLGFEWQSATETGAPVVTTIDSLRFDTAITGAVTPVYFDSVVCSLGSIYEAEYYSKYMFRDSAGAFKERVTADTDLLNLDTDSYGVFTECLAYYAAQQQQGKDSGYDIKVFQANYDNAVLSYNRLYPSQAKKVTGSYYKVKRSSYASKLGGVALRP